MFRRLQRNERNGRFAASCRLLRGSYYGVNAGGSASLSRPVPAIIRTSVTPGGKSNLPARIQPVLNECARVKFVLKAANDARCFLASVYYLNGACLID